MVKLMWIIDDRLELAPRTHQFGFALYIQLYSRRNILLQDRYQSLINVSFA
jgi:hypothetical protein